MEVCAAAGRLARELPVLNHNRGFYFIFCSKVQPHPGQNVFLVRQCSEGVTEGGCGGVGWGGKQGETFFFRADLGVNQQFLIAANLMTFSPLKQRWPWIHWPLLVCGPSKTSKGGKPGDFSLTADHLTLAWPRMCKAPIGNELPPQLLKRKKVEGDGRI